MTGTGSNQGAGQQKLSPVSLEPLSLVEDPFIGAFDQRQNVNCVITVTMLDVEAI